MRFLTAICFFMLLTLPAFANEVGLVFSDDELSSFENREVNPDITLTENLKEKVGSASEESFLDGIARKQAEKNKETPLDEQTPTLSSTDALQAIVGEKRRLDPNRRRSNASVFDVSGVMLRMSVLQAESALKKRGYLKISQGMQIPNFIKWRNEEKCRNAGVVGYERLESCVVKYSKQENAHYIETAKYLNKKTTEEVQIFMTSNFTGNKIYKIIYSTEITGIKGNSTKAQYLRDVKVYEFWRKVNNKYGRPDDEVNVSWSMGDNKPVLRAKTGFLVLEDPMLLELDWTRMSREDKRYLNTDMYNF